jgi:hypothetical protein
MRYRGIIFSVFVACVAGCASSPPDVHRPDRARWSAMIGDTTLSVEQGTEALDRLLDSFPGGTPAAEVERYVRWETQSRLGNDSFSCHITAPDGSHRWLTLVGDRLAE